MANKKDFATSTVLTPPSPATSGTTIVVQAGHGARFPAAPFYVTAHPPSDLPTLDNAEKLLVTAKSTDTFTITRGEADTTAKSIEAGWRISNSIYLDDLPIVDATSVEAAGAVMDGDFSSNGLMRRTGAGTYAIKGVPTGDVVGTTDTQTLTNKTISPSSNTITGINSTGTIAINKASVANGALDVYGDIYSNGSKVVAVDDMANLGGTPRVSYSQNINLGNGTHLNSIKATGFYGVYDRPESPLNDNGIYIGVLVVMAYSVDWVVQEFYSISGANSAPKRRMFYNGDTWTTWA